MKGIEFFKFVGRAREPNGRRIGQCRRLLRGGGRFIEYAGVLWAGARRNGA